MIESYFKKLEVPYELFSTILQNVEPCADQEWTGKLLLSLSKADNFEMTMMFCEDKEKTLIEKIVDKLPASVKTQV